MPPFRRPFPTRELDRERIVATPWLVVRTDRRANSSPSSTVSFARGFYRNRSSTCRVDSLTSGQVNCKLWLEEDLKGTPNMRRATSNASAIRFLQDGNRCGCTNPCGLRSRSTSDLGSTAIDCCFVVIHRVGATAVRSYHLLSGKRRSIAENRVGSDRSIRQTDTANCAYGDLRLQRIAWTFRTRGRYKRLG